MRQLVIFASASGSNAERVINHFKNSSTARVSRVFTNNKNAGVIERCNRLNIPFTVFNRADFFDSNVVLNQVKAIADYVILAGFLWKIPDFFVKSFENRIINIHPGLLPKYGGKGMYGMNVHNAVKENNEKETGITIHFVNENYDEGAIIFQAKTQLDSSDSPKDIANKIHLLEYEYFPIIIEKTILKHG